MENCHRNSEFSLKNGDVPQLSYVCLQEDPRLIAMDLEIAADIVAHETAAYSEPPETPAEVEEDQEEEGRDRPQYAFPQGDSVALELEAGTKWTSWKSVLQTMDRTLDPDQIVTAGFQSILLWDLD